MKNKSEIGLRAAIEMIPRRDPDYDSKVNQITAHMNAHDERTGENELIPFRLDDSARDRLIFYGRQDAAHALLNTITILKRINTMLKMLLAVTALLFVAFVYIATKHGF
jgi:hypothetical protein